VRLVAAVAGSLGHFAIQQELHKFMKTKLPSIILALVGVIFLIPSVTHLMKGEPLSFSPSLATAIGLFLGAIISGVVKRKSGGS